MKKLLVLLIIISMLTACSIPFAYPEGGQFYCDELQMMLDFSSENNEAIFEENGKEITGHFMTDFGARVYVEYTEYINGERIVHRVLAGKFRYRFGKVMVRTDDGEEYIFLPKAEVGLSTGVRGTVLLAPKKNHRGTGGRFCCPLEGLSFA